MENGVKNLIGSEAVPKTFLFSFTGVYLGNKFGHFFEEKIEMFGGLILIGIGIKILLEHLA